jgi:hypothetical protein
MSFEDCLFPSRLHSSPHLSTRQYARTKNLRVVQLLLSPHEVGEHGALPRIEVDDALEISEQTEV